MALALQGAGWLQPLRGGDAGAEEGDTQHGTFSATYNACDDLAISTLRYITGFSYNACDDLAAPLLWSVRLVCAMRKGDEMGREGRAPEP